MLRIVSRPTNDVQLRVLAFTAGFVSLAFEITFARLLAPSFGTSLFIWTNVIGVILAGMSLGAFLGGRAADRAPKAHILATITAATALYLLLLPAAATPILKTASLALNEHSASIFLASLVATLVMAFVPAATLGMVSPYVIRLRASSVKTVGSDAGGISALATVGSIIGTFVPTLWSIPTFGVRATIFGLAVLLILASLPLLGLGKRGFLLLLAPALAWGLPVTTGAEAMTIETKESPYQFIAVNEFPNGTRTLRLNEGLAIHSILVPGELRTMTIYDVFGLLPALHRGEMRTMANVGLAGGTIAHLFQQLYPAVQVTGIEIDPDVVAMGRKYFTLDEPNVTVVNQDGRIALATRPDLYDVIVVDAYRQPYIPFHLATREFFELCRDRLEPNGIFSMNVATIAREDEILTSILNTVALVYDEVWVYRVPHATNFLVFASNDPGIMDRLRAGAVPEQIRDLQTAVLANAERVAYDPMVEILTDDRAPVELYTDEMLIREGLDG